MKKNEEKKKQKKERQKKERGSRKNEEQQEREDKEAKGMKVEDRGASNGKKDESRARMNEYRAIVSPRRTYHRNP